METSTPDNNSPNSSPSPCFDLVERMALGDEDALAELYDATSPWIYGFVLRILRDQQFSEEVTLDVYLQAWKRSGSYSPARGSVRAWLCTMARSRAIDRIRTIRAERETSLHEIPQRLANAPTDSATIRDTVDSALEILPCAQRQAIELAYLHGMTHREIAAALERPAGTVKTQIRLGMIKLRDFLGSSSRERSR